MHKFSWVQMLSKSSRKKKSHKLLQKQQVNPFSGTAEKESRDIITLLWGRSMQEPWKKNYNLVVSLWSLKKLDGNKQQLFSSNLLQMTFTGLEHTCGIELCRVLINSCYPCIFVNEKVQSCRTCQQMNLDFSLPLHYMGQVAHFNQKSTSNISITDFRT